MPIFYPLTKRKGFLESHHLDSVFNVDGFFTNTKKNYSEKTLKMVTFSNLINVSIEKVIIFAPRERVEGHFIKYVY